SSLNMASVSNFSFSECSEKTMPPFESSAPSEPLMSSRFICSFQGCFAAYNKQWKLDAHLCKHTGVKPHTCGYQGCGKSFCSPYHLARHELIHSGDKPFPCTEEGCSEAFTTNSNRLRHIDRFHRDTQEPRLYVCKFEDCGLRFKKNKQLKSHMCEQHEKLPPYQWLCVCGEDMDRVYGSQEGAAPSTFQL
uniref:Transcription factor IIIA n=1 Tax=Periophthalmus magnuspinnatus TaxID=409849 RepID=A0A3B4AMY7_9GOBI